MFDYLQSKEEQRQKERYAMLNAELLRRLKSRTDEEAEKAFLEWLAKNKLGERETAAR